MGGFATLVPDLYRGKITKDYEEAGHLMSGLDWPGAVEDIRAAACFLMGKGCRKAAMGNKLGFEFYMYAAGHGFTNPEHPTNCNTECADLALSRTVKFMQRHTQTANV